MFKKLMYKMMVFLSRRMITCDEASYMISFRQDNPLGFRRWRSLKMHLLVCHLCRKYARQIDQLNHLLIRYRESYADPACHHHLSGDGRLKIQQAVSRELNVK
jgi:hypothetical protein